MDTSPNQTDTWQISTQTRSTSLAVKETQGETRADVTTHLW